MPWLLLSVVALITPVCQERAWRCEQRCAQRHTVGSMEHLKCNERCWKRRLRCEKGHNESDQTKLQY